MNRKKNTSCRPAWTALKATSSPNSYTELWIERLLLVLCSSSLPCCLLDDIALCRKHSYRIKYHQWRHLVGWFTPSTECVALRFTEAQSLSLSPSQTIRLNFWTLREQLQITFCCWFNSVYETIRLPLFSSKYSVNHSVGHFFFSFFQFINF